MMFPPPWFTAGIRFWCLLFFKHGGVHFCQNVEFSFVHRTLSQETCVTSWWSWRAAFCSILALKTLENNKRKEVMFSPQDITGYLNYLSCLIKTFTFICIWGLVSFVYLNNFSKVLWNFFWSNDGSRQQLDFGCLFRTGHLYNPHLKSVTSDLSEVLDRLHIKLEVQNGYIVHSVLTKTNKVWF